MKRSLAIALVLVAGLLSADGLPPRVLTSARGNVFAESEEVRLRLSEPVGSPRWTLCDWSKRPVAEGAWPATGELSLGRRPKGYYFVTVDGGANAVREGSFCVVPDPQTRRASANGFYATDAALSWVCSPDHYVENWYGTNSYAACLDLIRLCGLASVRERLRTREVSRRPGEYAWGRYLENSKLAKERGISVLGMFHDSPAYVSADGASASDMLQVYRFCRDAGAAFRGMREGWEFWNEPDIGFWHGSVWTYAAAMKAAYLGFKAADPQTPVLNGSTSKRPGSPFHVKMFQNDLAKYSNVFNFHLYDPLATFPGFMADLRRLLASGGVSGRQLWLTESTTSLEGRPAGVGLASGRKAHSFAQELVLAEMCAKDYVGMQMLGVSRFYLFTFGAFNESDGTDYGVQRRDGGVKPIYAAISAITERLGAAKPLGECRLDAATKCFAFAQPDGTRSVAVWTVSPGDTTAAKPADISSGQLDPLERTVSVPAADGEYAAANWCGTPLTLTARGGRLEIPVSRYATYVDGLKEVSVDVPAVAPGRVETYVPAEDEDLTVVLSVDFHPSDFALSSDKTSVDLIGNGRTGRVDLTVWNLSDRPKTGSLSAEGAVLSGMPDGVSVAPWGKAVVTAGLSLPSSAPVATDVFFGGRFGGRRITRAAASVRDLAALLKTCEVVDLGSNRLDFWRPNDTACASRMVWDETEGAVLFDCDWTADPRKDRWIYPIHDLDLPRESMDRAMMLTFEAKLDQDKIENDVRYSYLQLRVGNRLSRLGYLPPTRDWHAVQVSLNDGDPKTSAVGATGFMLGFNPQGTKCRFWIRNVKLILKEKTDEAR